MNFKEKIRKTLNLYFVLVTLITAAISILGNSFAPDAVLNYSDLKDPLLFAALGIIPSFIMYSKNELSVKQTIIRKIIQLVIIEAEILLLVGFHSSEGKRSFTELLFIGLSVLAVFVISNAIRMAGDHFSAAKMNQDLENFRKNAK